MTENTNISLNLQSPNISEIVYAVQNDKLSRYITAQLLDGSAAWTPPAGAGAFIRYLKPDGTAGFYDVDESEVSAISVSGSVATLKLVEQATTIPGDVYMQLNFYGADGSKLTTFAWILRVQKSVLSDATIVSSDYYNVLSAQITAVLNAAASLTGMTASATGLATGADPTVVVTGGSGGNPYNLAFGIPAGPVGPANAASIETKYQEGTSGTTAPTGTWQSSPPTVSPGNYLWTRIVVTWASGSPATYYSVARQGLDGTGAAGTATPLMDGVAAVGSSTSFAREDHVHPSDTTRATLAQVYPVGSIYMSVNSTDPGTLFGGTWEQLKDRFLLGAGDTYSNGATGGESDVTLTDAQIPAHTHTVPITTDVMHDGTGNVYRAYRVSGGETSYYPVSQSNTGGGGSHNNMPPYLVVYMWKRTA